MHTKITSLGLHRKSGASSIKGSSGAKPDSSLGKKKRTKNCVSRREAGSSPLRAFLKCEKRRIKGKRLVQHTVRLLGG